MMGRGWDYGTGMSSGGWIALLLSALFVALLVAGAIVLVIWAIRSAGHSGEHNRSAGRGQYMEHGGQPRSQGSGHDFLGPQSGRNDDAEDVARRRYAAGEITREQYDEIMTGLKR